ncbi:sigma-70 family RNA polymerase sigma factor, partial [bacterium]|nr:sigma-70 family RNA polymerase sigma factor [bacterium]
LSSKRVYGAMLDYLRTLDILSRSSRKLIKAIDFAVQEHMASNDEEPTDEALAILLDESIEKIHDARIASSIYTVMPLHDQLHVGDEGAALAQIEKDELVEVIKTILCGYNEREQMIIQLYYFEELTLKEISDVLDITESRISQIHKSVINKIKESVGA